MSKYNFEQKRNDYETPPELVRMALDNFTYEHKFGLDVCCLRENIPANNYYKFGEKDGLKEDWSYLNWCNPPFNKCSKWIKLGKILSQDIIIKNMYKNIDEFIKTLKSLDEIKFTAHRNIFTSQINSFKNIKDLFGIDEPESFTISAKYKVSVQENIKRTIEKFRNEQIQAPYSCLTCIGKDDYGIEQVFNENAFSKTISIILAQNEEKLLNPKSVFEELIRKIEGNA